MRAAEYKVLPFAAIQHDQVSDSFSVLGDVAPTNLILRLEAEGHGDASANVLDRNNTILAAGALTLGTYLEVVQDGIFVPHWAVEILLDGVPFGLMSRIELRASEKFFVAERVDWRRATPAPGLPAGEWCTPGTMIETGEGSQPVEWIEAGVLVATRDHGLQPVCQVLRQDLLPGAEPFALVDVPVRAFVNGGTDDGLVVTRDVGLMLCNSATQEHFGLHEVLAPAATWQDGFPLAHAGGVMTALVFRGQELVQTSCGVWITSWRATPTALASLAPMQQLGVLTTQGVVHNQVLPIRQVLTAKEAAQIAPRRRRQARIFPNAGMATLSA